MREIKFRLWDKTNKRMIAEPMLHFPDHHGFYWQTKESLGWRINMKSDMEAELMQFTGWLDHNNQEVYEGDIVQVGESYGVVVWDTVNDGWRIAYGNSYNLRNNEMVVVGNIYEHPGLLEIAETVKE